MPTSHTILKTHIILRRNVQNYNACAQWCIATVTERLEEIFCLVSGEEKYENLVANELMILFILPPLDYKMDVSSVNFSVARRTRYIDRLTL